MMVGLSFGYCKLNMIGSSLCILGGDGVSCWRRHEFGADRIGDRLLQNLIDRRARIRVKLPVDGAQNPMSSSFLHS